MSDVLHTRWLQPQHARAMARVERQIYPRASRSGLRDIRFDLERMQREGTAMSLGLFDGGRLVGYLFAYLQRDRARAFDEFEVRPPGAELCGESVYVEDMVLLSSHARHFGLMTHTWFREVARAYPTLPLDAFCRPALLERWRRHAGWLRRLGYVMEEPAALQDLSRDETWYWVSWRPTGAVGRVPRRRRDARPGTPLGNAGLPAGTEARIVRTEPEWLQLRADWERLVEDMREPSPFATFDLNFLWWKHFGMGRRLLILTVYRDGHAAGIAPLMASPERRLGRWLWWLQFIGDNSTVERPSLICPEEDQEAARWLWQAAAALRRLDPSAKEGVDVSAGGGEPRPTSRPARSPSEWDAALLYEQPLSERPHPLVEALAGAPLLVRESPPHEAPHVAIASSWEDYLASRSGALRKAFRRKLRRLEEQGEVRLVTCQEEPDFDTARALERYLELERRSWKHDAKQGIAAKAGHAAYYRELCEAFGRQEQGHEQGQEQEQEQEPEPLLAAAGGGGRPGHGHGRRSGPPAGEVGSAGSDSSSGAHFRFLYVADQPVAATFGVLHAGRYASLEICHDQAFDRYSPGMLLTGLELAACHRSAECVDYDFLSGTPENKLSWATGTRATRDVYLMRDDLHARVDAFVAFHLKPQLKQVLKKVRLHEPALALVNRLKALVRGRDWEASG